MSSEALTIVTNREPYRVRSTRTGRTLVPTAGGLVSALLPAVAQTGGCWFAWNPGAGNELGELARRLDHGLVLVDVSDDEVGGYYRGFANGTLWPLSHYALDRCRFSASDWESYVAVNTRFAERLLRDAPDGLIWVHDYHLMLVPELLRKGRRRAIAYFHHIPFPAAEVFEVLPWRDRIIDGLLGADLIGFHTHAYVTNFLQACEAAGASVDYEARNVVHGGRNVCVRPFPVGIDTDAFESLAVEPTVRAQARTIREDLDVEKLVLGVDRLDYTKGIQQRLEAIDRLLARWPEFRGKLTLLQIAVPSRTDVPEYSRFKRDIDESVGRINGRYSRNGWQPIHCIYRSFSHRRLVAHYVAADVALVTPLRDGMNLVAKEFCASRPDEDGVLVLSEFAGAAESLDHAALVVNPFDVERFAETIGDALTMKRDARRERMRSLREAVSGYDIARWTGDFLAAARASAGAHPSYGGVRWPESELGGARVAVDSR